MRGFVWRLVAPFWAALIVLVILVFGQFAKAVRRGPQKPVNPYSA